MGSSQWERVQLEAEFLGTVMNVKIFGRSQTGIPSVLNTHCIRTQVAAIVSAKLDRLRRSKNFPKIPKRKSRFQTGNQFLSLYDLFFIKEKLLASSRGIEVQSSLD